MKKHHYIIDFDSTFISFEILEHLASIALEHQPEKTTILDQIKEITNLGMEGTIPFQESLFKRLKLLKANKTHIEKLISIIQKNVTKSVKKNKKFFIKNSKDIYIISGAFKEFIIPIVKEFQIPQSHVLANTFTYDKNGNITGVDLSNPLAYKFGKAIAVAGLRLTGTIFIVGDGYSDFEIRQNGVGNYFIAFTENVLRSQIANQADCIAKDFDKVIEFFQSH